MSSSEGSDAEPLVVGFVGLGNIGSAIAGRLLDWPGGLIVHDLRPEAMAPFVEAGARAASTVEELASASDVISVMVLDDAQVRDVVATTIAVAAAGTVVAIHSTIDVETAPELAAAAADRGVHVIDAPVSGGVSGATDGRLAVMVGGDRAAYERAKPVFARWSELTVHVGPAGAGTAAKLARALLTFAGYAAATEAQRLGEAAGIDLRKLAAVVRHSDSLTGGPSAIMVRDSTSVLAADDPLRPIFEHTRGLGEKDLSLALTLGRILDIDLPFTQLALRTLAEGLGVPNEEMP